MSEKQKQLKILDPELADKIINTFNQQEDISNKTLDILIDDILWCFVQEYNFGNSVFNQSLLLIQDSNEKNIEIFHSLIRQYGNTGPTLGKIISDHIIFVLRENDKYLLELFLETVDTICSKGVYALYKPLDANSILLSNHDTKSVYNFLNLFKSIYCKDITYNQSVRLSRNISEFCLSLDNKSRYFQMMEMNRLISNLSWIDSFQEGMKKGLEHLSQKALSNFIDIGLKKYSNNEQKGEKFFSLSSEFSINTFKSLEESVNLLSIIQRLNRYAHARNGKNILIKSTSDINSKYLITQYNCFTDGQTIYLPDKINIFSNKNKNLVFYKNLTRLLSSYIEFKSFYFDLEKLLNNIQNSTLNKNKFIISNNKIKNYIINIKYLINTSLDNDDYTNFFSLFDLPELAKDLFFIFEQGRIIKKLQIVYPGLFNKILNQISYEMDFIKTDDHFLKNLYKKITFDKYEILKCELEDTIFHKIAKIFNDYVKHDCDVEISAELVCHFYDIINDMFIKSNISNSYTSFNFPSGMHLNYTLFSNRIKEIDSRAAKMKKYLSDNNLLVYKSDLRNLLEKENSEITFTNIKNLIYAKDNIVDNNQIIDLSKLNINDILEKTDFLDYENLSDNDIFWYREFNYYSGDYLLKYTRVCNRTIEECPNNFYENTLKKYIGLLSKIRKSFDLMRPEGLKLLRRWPEGDSFDYRALIDYAIDRKIKKTPCQRLYNKHVKQDRDVSVFLLIDLSRSTASIVNKTNQSVIDIEKEAIVLFCEALKRSGDNFSIAGFSGTGRMGVDFFKIKKFSDKMSRDIKITIGSIKPQRGTRMGAAIRHASTEFNKISSKIKILIVLSDGFPNDLEYKKQYAIVDTRKSIQEARSSGIYVHAITINLSSAAKLDELYGKGKHTIISNINELPNKLPLIYRKLTYK